MFDKWAVRIDNAKRENWDTVPALSEQEANSTAATVTNVNKSFQAIVLRNVERVTKYKRGAPVKMRKAACHGK